MVASISRPRMTSDNRRPTDRNSHPGRIRRRPLDVLLAGRLRSCSHRWGSTCCPWSAHAQSSCWPVGYTTPTELRSKPAGLVRRIWSSPIHPHARRSHIRLASIFGKPVDLWGNFPRNDVFISSKAGPFGSKLGRQIGATNQRREKKCLEP
jgi:hypothetical protein